jgi:predicted  nucleic acid-binding Zn-ribbon protein
MNDEQFERRMEFIVEQQAKFEVGIQQLQEAHAELTKKHNHLAEALTTVVGMVGRLGTAQELTDAKLAEAQQRADERFAELAVKHSETDERLNTLITVVERYISGNGRGPSPKRRTAKPTRHQQKAKQPRKK